MLAAGCRIRRRIDNISAWCETVGDPIEIRISNSAKVTIQHSCGRERERVDQPQPPNRPA
jgi:hypothetical protein